MQINWFIRSNSLRLTTVYVHSAGHTNKRLLDRKYAMQFLCGFLIYFVEKNNFRRHEHNFTIV